MMNNKMKCFGLLACLMLVAAPVMAAEVDMSEKLSSFVREMGFVTFFSGDGWKNLVMMAIGCFLLFLAIVRRKHVKAGIEKVSAAASVD